MSYDGHMLYALVFVLANLGQAQVVSSLADLRTAVQAAKPGDVIQLAPGTYSGGIHLSGIHGQAGKPIVIAGSDRNNPPKFVGGSTGLQLSAVSHLVLRDLIIEKTSANGLNIDDGGAMANPSHHVTIQRVSVSDLPKGNHDAIKLSGLDDFQVLDCNLTRWGGSGIDMVGCHRGVIRNCVLKDGGDNGVQAKSGSSDITIESTKFVRSGQRSVNLGGSTGAEFFRPSLASMGTEKYEARNLTVQGCTFIGSVAPIAFVGVTGAIVQFNTIINPERWAIRILQETRGAGFAPCRSGLFNNNLVVFSSLKWSSGGVNIGPETKPETFRFTHNYWYCQDRPASSTPTLPTQEVQGVYGIDPLLRLEGDTVSGADTSPVKQAGAHAFKPST